MDRGLPPFQQKTRKGWAPSEVNVRSKARTFQNRALLKRVQKDIQVMADFLLEIGLEEVPARMIAWAEAEL